MHDVRHQGHADHQMVRIKKTEAIRRNPNPQYSWRECKTVQSLWKTLVAPQNVKHRITPWLKNPAPRIPRVENTCPHKDLYTVFLAALVTTAKVKTALSPSADKCPEKGVLFRHIKEWSTETHHMNEPGNHDAEWMKPVTKATYCKTAFRGNSQTGKSTDKAEWREAWSDC